MDWLRGFMFYWRAENWEGNVMKEVETWYCLLYAVLMNKSLGIGESYPILYAACG